MGGMARGVQDLQAPSSEADGVALAHCSDTVRRRGVDRAEQALQALLPVHTPGARHELLRVRQVRSPSLMDPDGGSRESLGESADTTGMIQVDVGNDDVREVPGTPYGAGEGGAPWSPSTWWYWQDGCPTFRKSRRCRPETT